MKILGLLLILNISSGWAVETPDSSQTSRQDSGAPLEAPKTQQNDELSEYAFGSGIGFAPLLRRNSDIKYDRDSSETTVHHSDSFLLSISLLVKPKAWRGWRASAGIDFQSRREVSFINNLSQTKKFEATAAAAYAQAGFQFWRFYGEVGIQHPLDFRTEWSEYKLEVTPGARLQVGFEIFDNIQAEYFYSFHSYALKEKVIIGSNRDIRIFHGSSGFMLKFSGVDKK